MLQPISRQIRQRCNVRDLVVPKVDVFDSHIHKVSSVELNQVSREVNHLQFSAFHIRNTSQVVLLEMQFFQFMKLIQGNSAEILYLIVANIQVGQRVVCRQWREAWELGQAISLELQLLQPWHAMETVRLNELNFVVT